MSSLAKINLLPSARRATETPGREPDTLFRNSSGLAAKLRGYIPRMLTKHTRMLAAALLVWGTVMLGACRETPPGPAPAAAADENAALVPEATIKDLMLGLVDTSADAVWLSVTTTVDSRGIIDVRPQSDEQWAEVRYGALRLAEAANLLKIPGRHVALPGEKSVVPGIELEPEEMQAMIDKDPAGWHMHAEALHDAALLAVHAAEAKDPSKIFEVGETIERACEGCHRQYWYPNEALPELPQPKA